MTHPNLYIVSNDDQPFSREINPAELARINGEDDALYRAVYARPTRRENWLAEQMQADLDADLRIIGYGLAAAYLIVVLFRLAQLGVL